MKSKKIEIQKIEMGWNYRKRVKIAPGVHVNLSKRGISTSFGPKGMKITTGPNGTYLNSSIPGTGLYKRQKIGGNQTSSRNITMNKSSNSDIGCFLVPLIIGAVLVSSIYANLAIWGIVIVVIIVAFTLWEIGKDPNKMVIKEKFRNLSAGDTSIEASVLRAQYNYLFKKQGLSFDTGKDVPQSILSNYQLFVTDFSECLKMAKRWVVNSERASEAKSSASTSVERAPAIWKTSDRPYILPVGAPEIVLPKSSSLVFFPTFILYFKNLYDFVKLDYSDIKFSVNSIRFLEKLQDVPNDSITVGETWMYVNKSGEPDRRYSYNPKMIKVMYGELIITTPVGTFTYHSSRNTPIMEMTSSFNLLKDTIGNTMTSVEVEKSSNKIDKKNQAVDNSARKRYLQSMSQQYFDDVYSCVKCIVSFSTRILATEECLRKNIESSTIQINLGEGTITDIVKQYQYIVWADLIWGHTRMNHVIDTEKPHCFGLLLYCLFMRDFPTLTYENLEVITSDLCHSVNDIIQQNIPQIPSNLISERGLLSLILLEGVDSEVIDQYRVLLYRYFSLTAKADGVVSDPEQTFLSSIMVKRENQNNTIARERHLNSTKAFHTNSLRELENLIGLTNVKQEVTSLSNYIKIQQVRTHKGLKSTSISYHCIFTGNPGTGKTTVARIVAGIYKEMGILKKGHLIETDRAGLVAEYVGQTAVKTNAIIDSALDGVLFIDEAYSLISGSSNDYGKEAISTLLKRMEDDRSRLVVILAGYTKEMKDFIDTNPGLQSRFNRYIEFPDYSSDELLEIFELNVKKFDYNISDEVKAAIKDYFRVEVENKDKNFGNARFVRNFFEKTLERQADRLSRIPNVNSQQLTEIIVSDLPILHNK